jgi:hypothetical protein
VTAHLTTIGVAVLDAVALVLFAAAAIASFRIAIGWTPGAATRGQLDLERRAELMSLAARGGTAAFLASTVLLVASVAGVLPGLTAGAMCGTGVLEGMAGEGERALVLRGIAIAALAAWVVIDRLNRLHPLAPITLGVARAQLIAFALFAVAAIQSATALHVLDPTTPVGCCTELYLDAAGADAPTRLLGDTALLAVLAAATAVILALGVGIAASARAARRSTAGSLFGLLMLAWIGLSATAMVRVGAAYHYEVLSHECPWCLFRAENAYVGYALLAALAVGLFEGIAVVVASGVARRVPELTARAAHRARRGALGAVIAVVVFLALGAGPAIAWRLRFGTWL